jgi:hypothetical protein
MLQCTTTGALQYNKVCSRSVISTKFLALFRRFEANSKVFLQRLETRRHAPAGRAPAAQHGCEN